jgi:quercetin dioxygenase-like cupin family protein
MRRLVTGTDSDGRSCIVEARDVTFTDALPGLAVDGLYATTESPPPTRPAGRGQFLDLAVAPGRTQWALLRYDAGGEYPMHHTDTVDFDIVLEGAIELTLDDGVHELAVGDCVVMTGVDHAWRAGPDGCTLSVLSIGTPPP